MKKYVFLAALLCGTSVVSMASDSGKPKKVQPIQPLTTFVNSENIEQVELLSVFDYMCATVTLSCGLTGQECGEDYQIGWQVLQAEASQCGNY